MGHADDPLQTSSQGHKQHDAICRSTDAVQTTPRSRSAAGHVLAWSTAHLMGKLKKSKASPAATSASATSTSTPTLQDETILDDLFAQLDAQDEGTNNNKPPPATAAGKTPGRAGPSTSSSDKKMTMNGAMSSARARFKVREVGILYSVTPAEAAYR